MILSNETDMIVTIPIEYADDFEKLAIKRGWKSSREMMANFIKRQLQIEYNYTQDKLERIY